MATKILMLNKKTNERKRMFSVDARDLISKSKGEWVVAPPHGDQGERPPQVLPPAKVLGEPTARATELANAGGVDPLAASQAAAAWGGGEVSGTFAEAAEASAELERREREAALEAAGEGVATPTANGPTDEELAKDAAAAGSE